jgi:hypothetical protein
MRTVIASRFQALTAAIATTSCPSSFMCELSACLLPHCLGHVTIDNEGHCLGQLERGALAIAVKRQKPHELPQFGIVLLIVSPLLAYLCETRQAARM